jgi:hypothetical protein
MGIEKGIIAESATKDSSLADSQQQHRRRFMLQYLPLWLCLLLALIVRAWLVFHTRGVIDGDEAMVGIQAQHILRGELPVYYISQVYMGSLEAYLVALLFAITGSSVWTLRAEPVLLSLLVVWLTWKLAGILADAAKLPPYAKRSFMIIATLFAALPPLYDAVIELRTLGGYIETFVLILILLISAFRLTQQWHEGAPTRELALRWAGIGFVVGLGFWVNPLISSAVLAAAIWIVGYCLQAIWSARKLRLVSTKRDTTRNTNASRRMRGVSPAIALPDPPALPTPSLAAIALPALTAIPACIIGFAPPLYWGATNSWANIIYLLTNQGGVPSQRLAAINNVAHLYTSCIARRIIGGALPDVNITATLPRLFTPGLAIGVLYLLATVSTFTLSLFWRHPLLVQIRQLVGLPLLFGVCTAFIFCISKISAVGLLVDCNNVDYAGRYATPLLLALPFLFAASFTFVSMYLHEKGKEPLQQGNSENSPSYPQPSRVVSRLSLQHIMQAGLFAVLLLIVCAQGLTYAQTNAGYTFQTSGCVAAPANNDTIIEYMQREHIHYAWAPFWIGNPVIFKTKESIIIADPRIITTPRVFRSRIPAYTSAVVHANRPSVLALVPHSDSYPQLLRNLDTEHITYHVARFPSEPGVDLLVVTPLNHVISPFESNSLGAWLYGC